MSDLLPNKYIRMSESIVGGGSIVIGIIRKKKTSVDKIFSQANYIVEQNNIRKKFSLDEIILILDFLYTLGLIDLDNKGNIVYAPSKTLF